MIFLHSDINSSRIELNSEQPGWRYEPITRCRAVEQLLPDQEVIYGLA
jgi:hypothetical protein